MLISPSSALTIVVLLTAVTVPALRADEPEAHFEKGLSLFAEAEAYWKDHPSDRVEISKRYRQAALEFVAAWKSGAITSEVLTNAANSFSFAGATGEAVLFYRRALTADPGNDAARLGLEHTREKLPIRPRREASATLAESLFFWHQERNFHLRRLSFSILFPAAWVLFALELFGRKRSAWNGPYAILGYLGLAASIACAASLIHESITKNPDLAAVIIVAADGRTGPGDQYQPSHTEKGAADTALVFPAGTEVEMHETGGISGKSWTRVRLLDDSESWIPTGRIERVVPESATRED